MGRVPLLPATSTTFGDRCLIEGRRGFPRECDTPRSYVHLLPHSAVALLLWFVGLSLVCLVLSALVWFLSRPR
jgi:hypothetical protein